jgi:histone deacetylase complex subunit SAP18
MVQVGMVHNSRTSEDDHRTLKSVKFQTGDYLDVAIYPGI